MSTVAVIDYGMGNLRSVAQAVLHAAQGTGVEVVITSQPEQVRAADRVVLPGQGAMRDCMRELRDSGLLPVVLEAAASKPLFGVCVGMQMLLEHSAEGGDGGTASLGLMPGEVVRFDLAGQHHPFGGAHLLGAGGDDHLHACALGGMQDRLRDRAQIPHAVIDDRDRAHGQLTDCHWSTGWCPLSADRSPAQHAVRGQTP